MGAGAPQSISIEFNGESVEFTPIASGCYSRIYYTPRTDLKLIRDNPYSGPWVLRCLIDPRRGWPGELENSGRIQRIWREITGLPILQHDKGLICPYLGTEKPTEDQTIAAIIDIYKQHRRLVVDGCTGQPNFLLYRDKTVCIDVGYALRRGSMSREWERLDEEGPVSAEAKAAWDRGECKVFTFRELWEHPKSLSKVGKVIKAIYYLQREYFGMSPVHDSFLIPDILVAFEERDALFDDPSVKILVRCNLLTPDSLKKLEGSKVLCETLKLMDNWKVASPENCSAILSLDTITEPNVVIIKALLLNTLNQGLTGIDPKKQASVKLLIKGLGNDISGLTRDLYTAERLFSSSDYCCRSLLFLMGLPEIFTELSPSFNQIRVLLEKECQGPRLIARTVS